MNNTSPNLLTGGKESCPPQPGPCSGSVRKGSYDVNHLYARHAPTTTFLDAILKDSAWENALGPLSLTQKSLSIGQPIGHITAMNTPRVVRRAVCQDRIRGSQDHTCAGVCPRQGFLV